MVIALGVDEFRPWLTIMIKTFKLTDHTILSMLIDGDRRPCIGGLASIPRLPAPRC